MARQAVCFVKSPEQWRVLLSPARFEIVQGLRCLGPSSIAEVGEMINRPADALYRHVELLKDAGFVRSAGTRKVGRHVEQLLDVTADDFAMDFGTKGDKSGQTAMTETAGAFLRGVQRAVRDAAGAGELEIQRDARNFLLNVEISWLTPEQFREVRGLMYKVKLLMDAARPEKRGRLYTTLTVAVPVVRRRGSKNKRASDEAQKAS